MHVQVSKTFTFGLLLGILILLTAIYTTALSLGLPARDWLTTTSGVNLVSAFNNSYPEQAPASGQIVEYSLVAQKNHIQLVNDQEIEMWTYNSQLPGPQMRISLGQTLKINFTNNLPQETTIHFHGVRVPNAMDGVPGVTQAPIKPGETFVYTFTPKDAGTYWYHPHVRGSEQLERGLYGALIVEDPQEPKYSQDIVWMLDDLRTGDDGQVYPYFNTPHDVAHDGRWGNVFMVNGQTDFKQAVRAGDRLRLRIINASNARVYQLDFGELDAIGFAVDGLLASETFSAQGFIVAPGNRLDVDIIIPAISRTRPYYVSDMFTDRSNRLVTLNVLDKLGSAEEFLTPTAKNHPDWSQAMSTPPFHDYRLNAQRRGHMQIQWTMDNQAYPNSAPIELEKNKFYKLRFTNESYRLHPMHIHGQFFKVLARNGQPVSEPYWRDTVLIKRQEVVDIGLVPLDNGNWANHCHILEHAESGMMTTIKVI